MTGRGEGGVYYVAGVFFARFYFSKEGTFYSGLCSLLLKIAPRGVYLLAVCVTDYDNTRKLSAWIAVRQAQMRAGHQKLLL